MSKSGISPKLMGTNCIPVNASMCGTSDVPGISKENAKLKFEPGKLAPPIEAAKRMMDADFQRLPKNPVLRFCKIFFHKDKGF